ncbi:SDR family NAD(P)-dependent oxidoreductase, partial [Sphingomonas sp.]|uniref:SDR family NAD(P)-dependent oxidoreductase n=1 Tax=Sphingomonas sp. TaxID=28214 RepID=UPI002BA86494
MLVANAGVGTLAPFASTTEEMFDRLFAITKGTFFAMQEASSRLRAGGRIVGISTGLTRNWAPMGAAYVGSKAAVEQFARSLSKEVGARDITVNMVLPGVVETDNGVGSRLRFGTRRFRSSRIRRWRCPRGVAIRSGWTAPTC